MVLGKYVEAVAAKCKDKEIQKVSQDGGVVSGLLIYALEEGIIEGAVVSKVTDEPWKPQPHIATTRDEILAAAGTKYTMCPNVWMIKEATRQYGIEKLGIVGVPCQIGAVRKMQTYPFGARFVPDKIKLIVGIYCMENFPYSSLETFVSEKMNLSLDIVDKMDIGKGKFWAYTVDETATIPLKETHGYEQSSCKVCNDYTAELADISTGSVGTPDGWSTVLTRTKFGDKLFKEAVEVGMFETKPIEEVKPGLGLLKKLAKQKKERAEKTIEERKKLGLPVP
ncbi:coenzyme F420-reducing hydrogenase, beta subunit [Methanothermus fervidus DSM 2088]|uniref:Coenzyme F420 hydrogenase subunit beta n=1 Tax=Methanothermus fervidus (strain ATCC 43054 / DSM 2088 / JCM 10308 / V24 S) TaxID=523846 RepID=E3GW65_METFV|nr:coenzyme F420 hydrogenase subunit beta [Methanothermus fervidus]ADP77830.1 coenzyme F420-reducing hydrogenase, beta subunit [Methanothermus fervidus DSM 2088]